MKYLVFLVAAILSAAAETKAAPTLESYGNLPSIRSMSVSPSGNRVAYLGSEAEKEFAAVYDLEQRKLIAAMDTRKIKAHAVYFATEDYVVLRASKTTKLYGFWNEFEFTAAFSWDYAKGSLKHLLGFERNLFPAQTGLGRIVGRLAGTDNVIMPAYIGSVYSTPSNDLLKVNLKNGLVTPFEEGKHETRNWLVGEDGAIIAREDYDDKDDRYEIFIYEDGWQKEIFEETDVAIPDKSLIGVTPDGSALIVAVESGESGRTIMVALTPDGKLSDPLFAKPDADVERIIADENRVVYGVEYSGLTPTYEFFDPALGDLFAEVRNYFTDGSVSIRDWTADFSHLILYASGGASTPSYYILDVAERNLTRIGNAYTDIKDEDVGPVYKMQYKARDGAPLTAILTLPPGTEVEGAHPTILMPHGGPAAYDSIRFDWLAQFFASKGYAVIQPNFRGSRGFGRAFEHAGHGEWGRGVMQHDVSDALSSAVEAGISDPENVCIVGGSYGGYAALAGGAFTPALYKCVAAIAPVADLSRMLLDEKNDNGRDSAAVAYWSEAIGDRRDDREKLESISPSNFAAEFDAPVLLIHGDDDTVVPILQSYIMRDALQKAGKDFEFVKVKSGDHWMTTSDMRLETLRALDGFVSKHMPARR